jgi:hypothetical protein
MIEFQTSMTYRSEDEQATRQWIGPGATQSRWRRVGADFDLREQN